MYTLVLLACAGPEPLPAALPTCAYAEVLVPPGEGNRPTCREPVAGAPACADPSGDGEERVDMVVYEALAGVTVPGLEPLVVVEDEAEWAALRDALDARREPEPVDFTVEAVAVASYGVWSTCGLSLVEHHFWSSGPELRATWEDLSGACQIVCDRGLTSWIAWRIPRGSTPVLCADVINRCF